MEIEKIRKIWQDMGMSCRLSWKPEKAEEFLIRLGLPKDLLSPLIYTEQRYRELSDGKPRVDGEDLLIFVFKQFDLKPNQEKLKFAYSLNGEGSRRSAIERAYLDL